jgi:hypothetical protein
MSMNKRQIASIKARLRKASRLSSRVASTPWKTWVDGGRYFHIDREDGRSVGGMASYCSVDAELIVFAANELCQLANDALLLLSELEIVRNQPDVTD